MSDLEEQKPGISRRTVAKAAAWSVPAIALAVSTPAYAASPGFIDVTGDGCKLPGRATDVFKGYAFEGEHLQHDGRRCHHFDHRHHPQRRGSRKRHCCGSRELHELGSTFVVASGTEDLRVAILTQGAGNSANGTLVLTYTVDGVADAVTVQADAAPPIVGGGACTTFSAAEKACLASLAD